MAFRLSGDHKHQYQASPCLGKEQSEQTVQLHPYIHLSYLCLLGWRLVTPDNIFVVFASPQSCFLTLFDLDLIDRFSSHLDCHLPSQITTTLPRRRASIDEPERRKAEQATVPVRNTQTSCTSTKPDASRQRTG